MRLTRRCCLESLESRETPAVLPLALESLVNATIAGEQRTFFESPQAVAMRTNGDYVVAWSSLGQDGSGWGVYARQFDRSGAAQGPEFRVNTTSAGDQRNAVVAVAGNGEFVIAWQSAGQDGSGAGIFAQRFDPAGVPVGGEFQVNTTTVLDQAYPSIALDQGGDFVIAWSSQGQDGSGWGRVASALPRQRRRRRRWRDRQRGHHRRRSGLCARCHEIAGRLRRCLVESGAGRQRLGRVRPALQCRRRRSGTGVSSQYG